MTFACLQWIETVCMRFCMFAFVHVVRDKMIDKGQLISIFNELNEKKKSKRKKTGRLWAIYSHTQDIFITISHPLWCCKYNLLMDVFFFCDAIAACMVFYHLPLAAIATDLNNYASERSKIHKYLAASIESNRMAHSHSFAWLICFIYFCCESITWRSLDIDFDVIWFAAKECHVKAKFSQANAFSFRPSIIFVIVIAAGCSCCCY